MRVISGKFSGRKIYSPKGKGIRPTSDRFKETLFNIIEYGLKINLKDKNILDVFAGSGSLGIEAISRGAKSCLFIDKSSISIETIQKNIITLDISSNSNCLKTDVNRISKFSRAPESKFDIIFSDPPYINNDLNIVAIDKLIDKGWLNDNAYLFIETSQKNEIPEINFFDFQDKRVIGDSSLLIYLSTSY